MQIIFDEFSFEELKDELEEIPNISDITPYRLRHEKIGPRNIEAYRKLRLEKSNTDGYIILLMGETRSLIGDFESHFKTKNDLHGDDIQLILKQYTSNFVFYELSPGIYSIKKFSGAVKTMGDREQRLQIE